MCVLCFNEEEDDSQLFLTQRVGKNNDQSMPKEPLTIIIRQLMTELLLSEGRGDCMIQWEMLARKITYFFMYIATH
jgi:hypothetical protein